MGSAEPSMPRWEALKLAAEDAFNNSDYKTACDMYAGAVKAMEAAQSSPSEEARLHSDRSVALQRMQSWDAAVCAAQKAVVLDKEWDKGNASVGPGAVTNWSASDWGLPTQ